MKSEFQKRLDLLFNNRIYPKDLRAKLEENLDEREMEYLMAPIVALVGSAWAHFEMKQKQAVVQCFGIPLVKLLEKIDALEIEVKNLQTILEDRRKHE